MTPPNAPDQRELFITPSVKWFLECLGKEDYVMELTNQISRTLNSQRGQINSTLLTSRYFMIRIFEPAEDGKAQRVLVWNAHEDGGALFSEVTPEMILESAIPWGVGLQ